jgi:hypothetical protein
MFALEMLVNDVILKTLEVNTCNNSKILYRELISVHSCS